MSVRCPYCGRYAEQYAAGMAQCTSCGHDFPATPDLVEMSR